VGTAGRTRAEALSRRVARGVLRWKAGETRENPRSRSTMSDHDRTEGDTDHRARLRAILDDAGTVMLVSRKGDELHARPMAVARVGDDDKLYFVTSKQTGKVDELEADPRVDVFFQSKRQFAALAGRATLSTERKLVDELWKDAWKVWLPDGKDDPNLVIVVVDPERGEYWDQAGTRGLSFLYRAAKALVTHTTPEPDPDSHAKVKL
jgi:general stress protein 26